MFKIYTPIFSWRNKTRKLWKMHFELEAIPRVLSSNVVSIHGGPLKWMVCNGRSHQNEWFGGYPYFRKPPNIFNIDAERPSSSAVPPGTPPDWGGTLKPELRSFGPWKPWTKLRTWFDHSGGFLTCGYPSHHPFQIGVLHDKPSILGYPHLWNPPYESEIRIVTSQTHGIACLFSKYCDVTVQKNVLTVQECGGLSSKQHPIVWIWPSIKRCLQS